MASTSYKDGKGLTKYLKVDSGTGTELNPFVPNKDVVIQDQISNAFIIPFHKEVATTTLTTATAKDDRTIIVSSSTGFAEGQLVTLYNVEGLRFYKGRILGTPTTTVALDSPIDFEYQIGDQVTAAITNMAVDGSVTPQIFKVRGPSPGTPTVTDVTRVLFSLQTATDPGFSKFGDLPALTNGIVLRRVDGDYLNYFNAKTNAELAGVMYDIDFLDLVKFGVAGVKGRLTFAGQNKLGVAVRVNADENLEVIIQDDLTGLESFLMIAEGHIVE